MAIFVSGGGTNCENIIKYFNGSDVARPVLVISNKPGVGAIEKAERLGVPVRVVRKAGLNDPDVILPLLREFSVDFIVLAGFLLVIPDFLIHEYDHRMIYSDLNFFHIELTIPLQYNYIYNKNNLTRFLIDLCAKYIIICS